MDFLFEFNLNLFQLSKSLNLSEVTDNLVQGFNLVVKANPTEPFDSVEQKFAARIGHAENESSHFSFEIYLRTNHFCFY